MKCPDCGTEYKEGAQFCYHCGSRIEVAEMTEEQEKDLARMNAKQDSVRDEQERQQTEQQKQMAQKSPEDAAERQNKVFFRVVTICSVVVALAIAAAAVFILFSIYLPGGNNGRAAFKPLTAYSSENAEELKSQVVKVTNTVGDNKVVGTGYFTPDGCLVTGSNVVDMDGTITITYADGSEDQATLVSNDIYSNTAILRVNEPKVQAFSFAPQEGSDAANFRVIGFQGDEKEPVVLEATGTTVESGGGNVISLEMSLDKSLIGAPVVNDAGSIVGTVMLANKDLDFALAGTSSFLLTETQTLMKKQTPAFAEEPVRLNQYTDVAVETKEVQPEELYTEGIYIRGELVRADGFKLSVDQKNSHLVLLNYDGTGCEQGCRTGIGDLGSSATITVVTDKGSFSIEVQNAVFEPGDKGFLPLDFHDYEGTAKELQISALSVPSSDTVESVTMELEQYVKDAAVSAEAETESGQKLIDELENDADFVSFVTEVMWEPLIYSHNGFDSSRDYESILNYIIAFGGINFGEQDAYKWDDILSEGAFATDSGGARTEESVKWYAQTIFNVSEEAFEAYKTAHKGLGLTFGYDENKKIFENGAVGWGGFHVGFIGIKSAEKQGNLYSVDFYGIEPHKNPYSATEMGSIQWGRSVEEFDSNYVDIYHAVLEKKIIDGETCWSVHSLTLE